MEFRLTRGPSAGLAAGAAVGKVPKEKGRGMTDGLFCLGPPPGLLSRRNEAGW